MRTPCSDRSARALRGILVACTLGLSACTCLSNGQVEFDVGMMQRGVASWYGEYFHGRTAAGGEIYDMYAMTAAHRTLPLGTVVNVLNVLNGRQVLVRINDRGPYKKGRILDLSYGAALKLHMAGRGVAPIQLEVVGRRIDFEPASLAWRTFATLSVSRRIAASEQGGRFRTPGACILMPHNQNVARVRVRPHPVDCMRVPRARRVGDILEAEHRVYASVSGLLVV